MSLNRSEQSLYDYIKRHPEERQYIQGKVQTICASPVSAETATARLESELWRYYEERSAVVTEFKEAVRAFGLRRTSMRNLADYLVRIWTEPRPRKSPDNGCVARISEMSGKVMRGSQICRCADFRETKSATARLPVCGSRRARITGCAD